MSNTDKKKRVRAPNYSLREKESLLNIVSKYKHIIENKKTDAISVDEKKDSWAKITEDFNSTSPEFHHRSAESLRKYYDKLKEDLRKKQAEIKKDLYMTGGGPQMKTGDDPCDSLLLEIMNKKTVYGLNNPYDNDFICTTNTDETEDALENFSQRSDCQIVYEEDNIEAIGKDMEHRKTPNYELIYEKGNLGKEGQGDMQKSNMEWKKIKASDLNKRLHPKINKNIHKTYTDCQNNIRKNTARRRPTIIRALTSSKLGEKYNMLINKKLELLECYKKEHNLRMESLELHIALKKNQLKTNNANVDKLPSELLLENPNVM